MRLILLSYVNLHDQVVVLRVLPVELEGDLVSFGRLHLLFVSGARFIRLYLVFIHVDIDKDAVVDLTLPKLF